MNYKRLKLGGDPSESLCCCRAQHPLRLISTGEPSKKASQHISNRDILSTQIQKSHEGLDIFELPYMIDFHRVFYKSRS